MAKCLDLLEIVSVEVVYSAPSLWGQAIAGKVGLTGNGHILFLKHFKILVSSYCKRSNVFFHKKLYL